MIDVERLLTDLGIEYYSGGGKNLRARCINPAHEDTNPSMYVHKESALFQCFACSIKGNIFTLLSYKGIRDPAEILAYVRKFDNGGETEEEMRQMLERRIGGRVQSSKQKQKQIEEFIKYGDIELPKHRMLDSHFYLEKRGITPQEIKKWGMAVVTQGRNLGWILIPIYKNGVLRNYFLRSTFGSGKLYGEYPRSDLLAGIDFATDYEQPICVTEGIFDAIAVARVGFQAVACLANKLLPLQLDMLKSYKKVVIVPDTDEPGLKLVVSAGPLESLVELRVFPLPSHRKDAADCTPEELLLASSQELPWNDYVIRKKFLEKIS